MSGTVILRTYSVGRARISHDHCMWCGHPILPGESYEATVYAGGGMLWVSKEHTNCPDDPWDDDEWDSDWNNESDSDSIPDISPRGESLPLAA